MAAAASDMAAGLALNAEGGAPAWIQILPPGVSVRGRDGRAWQLPDPGAVLRAFNTQGADLPIDYEHQEDDPRQRVGNGPVPAAGWIKALRHDPAGGLMAQVEWTATARRMIEAREYRYLSPVFNHDRQGTITRLLGASLVHRPNLQLKALSRGETRAMTEPAMSNIATALGLDAEATEADILTAINRAATPDPARFVPIDAVRELMTERARSRASATEEIATNRVQQAMDAGYLTPAMRDWALALCKSDPDSFDSFLKSAAPAYAHLFEPAPRLAMNSDGRQGRGHPAATAEEAAVFAQLGLDPSGSPVART